MPNTRLMRSETDKVLGGVCSGIAIYLNIDPVLVRLAFLVLLFASGIGLPMYLILWVVMPKANFNEKTGSIIQENVHEISETVSDKIGNPGAFGVVLILLGVFFLLHQFGVWSGFVWPILIIGLGAYLFAKRRQ